MNKITGIIIGVIIVAFGGLVTWAIINKGQNAVDYDKYDINQVIAASADNGEIGDHIEGSPDAEVFLVEYADFQCPGCAAAHPRVRKLLEEYDGKVAVIYRNFLMSYHKNGLSAASAAEAASLQGKWREMADILFANQAVWENLSETARGDAFAQMFMGLLTNEEKEAGKTLDRDKFIEDMGSARVKKKLDFDQTLAKKAGSTGTPSFFLDGESVKVGGTDEAFLENMRAAIEPKLKK
jgi:protein-disulfide isomerase